MTLVLGIILFVLLVIVHEYGHFLAAKKNGVEVEEFGIGFPPKLYGRKLGKGIFEGYYSINLIPLGGFVRLKGENDADKRRGSLGAAPLKAKSKIIMAGVAMNVLAAFVIMSIVAAVRMPVVFDNQFTVNADTQIITNDVVVGDVVEGSPADKASIDRGDVILSANEETITSVNELSDFTKSHAGEEVLLRIRTEDGQQRKEVVLKEESDTGSFLGVKPFLRQEQRSTWSAPIVGVGMTLQLSWETVKALGSAIGDLAVGDTAGASQNVGGPVLIVAVFSQLETISQVLFLTGSLSIALAIFNALPIPALDGGRLFVMLIFRALKKPLTPKIENAIHGLGFMLLLLLVILITIVDIGRI